jgi:glycosyltransferase involved in cell wall biosynthesis
MEQISDVTVGYPTQIINLRIVVRIAQIAPLYESVPPKLYGGTERIVAYLTDELLRRGHHVTLFASGDSETKAELVPGCEVALRLGKEGRNPVLQHLLMLEELRLRSDDFDIIHFHIDLLQFPLLRFLGLPALTTLHGRLDIPGIRPFYREYSEANLVAISRSQRRDLPKEARASLVYHGLPPGLLSPRDGQGAYLAFLGRISPEKGPVEAIEIALAAGMPLKIAAKIDPRDEEYWTEMVKPLVDRHPSIDFVGEIADKDKTEFLGNATALLFPIDWPEPFGLVMIEAMACGTPVIAYPMGSVPEVIEEGRSGYIVGSRDAAVAAVGKAMQLDRKAVRQCFDRRFSVACMADNYLKLYEKLLQPEHANGFVHKPPLAAVTEGMETQTIRSM